MDDKTRWDAARALYAKLVGKHADSTDLKVFQGASEKQEERVAALNEIAADYPDSFRAQLEVGRAYLARGLAVGDKRSLKKAEKALKDAIKLKDKLLPARVLLGDVYMGLEKSTTARKEYQEALDEDSDYYPARLRMGLCWHYMGKGAEKGLPELRRLVAEESFPRLVAGWWLIAHISADLGEYDDAVQAIDKVLSIDKDDLAALIAKGQILLASEEHSEAVKVFLKATKVAPKSKSFEAWFCLGWAHEKSSDAPQIQDAKKKERLAAAADAYERCTELAPGERARDSLGFVLLLGERHGDAMKQFEMASDLNPKFAPARNNLGLGNDIADNRALAKKRYDQVLSKIDKANVRAMVMLALDYWLDGAKSKAIKLIGKALKIRPDDDLAWTFLGDIYEEDRKYPRALKCYRKAVEINEKNFIAWFHQGKILDDKQKKHEDADKCYRKALEAKADPPPELALRLAEVNDEKALDRLEEALKFYMLYVDLGGTEEWVPERIEVLKEDIK